MPPRQPFGSKDLPYLNKDSVALTRPTHQRESKSPEKIVPPAECFDQSALLWDRIYFGVGDPSSCTTEEYLAGLDATEQRILERLGHRLQIARQKPLA